MHPRSASDPSISDHLTAACVHPSRRERRAGAGRGRAAQGSGVAAAPWLTFVVSAATALTSARVFLFLGRQGRDNNKAV